MSTTLLLCQCDSIVTKACGALIPAVRETYEAGTNCYDVSIADVICKSIVIIVAILVAGFLAWKIIDHNASENEQEFKKQKEKEESERKQKAEFFDKYLDFLKEQASKDDKLIQDYKDVLAGFKESLRKDNSNKGKVDNNIAETDHEKIVNILIDQMEFLKEKGFKSNAVAEREYKQVLVYLIQQSQQGKLNEFSRDSLNVLFNHNSSDEK